MEESEWPELMKVAEVAIILRVSKMTVYRMIHNGELPLLNVGERNFRIRAEDVRNFLDGPLPQFNLN